MPLPADLVHQTTTGSGVGNLVLSPVSGRQTFSTAFGTGGTNVFDYFISQQNTSDYERGTGHILVDGVTLVRDTVYESTNSNSLVNFGGGKKDITNDIPAAHQYFHTIGTRSEAAAATLPASLTFINTSGYATAGDGGGATYIRQISNPGTGGFQSADGAWWALNATIVKPHYFGAKGDGTTDDTSAINSAISFCAALSQSTLYFPTSRYLVSGNLDISSLNNCTICGDGMFESLLINHCAAGVNLFVTTSTGTPGTRVNVTFRDFGILGLWVSRQVLDSCFPITLTDISEFRFQRLYIANSTSMGMAGRNCVDIEVTDCLIYQAASDGISFNGQGITISNNVITHIGDDAISCHVDNVATSRRESLVIVGNSISDAQGIKCIGARKAVIADNKIERVFAQGIAVDIDTGAGFHAGDFSVSVTGNTITDVMNGSSAGFSVANSADYIRINSQYQAGSASAPPGANVSSTGLFVDLYSNLTNSASANPLAGAWWVNVSGNVCTRTFDIGTTYSSQGYGNKFLPTGYSDFTMTSSVIAGGNGLSIQPALRKGLIHNNIFNGVANGIVIGPSSNIAYIFEDVLIHSNIFSDFNTFGVWFVNTAITSSTTRNIRIVNNTFDGDPFQVATHRGSTGGWSGTSSQGPVGIFTTTLTNLYEAEGNIFRNVVSPTDTFGFARNNILECNPSALGFSASNLGIGNLPNSGVGWLYRIVDCNPNNSTYGNVLNVCVIEASAQPSSGTYVEGHFVQNNTPVLSSNKTTLGWIRLTTGSAHVANTDWAALVVPNS